jgi:hypothetical protein
MRANRSGRKWGMVAEDVDAMLDIGAGQCNVTAMSGVARKKMSRSSGFELGRDFRG